MSSSLVFQRHLHAELSTLSKHCSITPALVPKIHTTEILNCLSSRKTLLFIKSSQLPLKTNCSALDTIIMFSTSVVSKSAGTGLSSRIALSSPWRPPAPWPEIRAAPVCPLPPRSARQPQQQQQQHQQQRLHDLRSRMNIIATLAVFECCATGCAQTVVLGRRKPATIGILMRERWCF
jgi:hypothetical protein